VVGEGRALGGRTECCHIMVMSKRDGREVAYERTSREEIMDDQGIQVRF
jgi:hypothetical protein